MIWAVPFAVACCLVNPEDGSKAIDPDWFRVLMLTIGSATSACATRTCDPQTRKEGVSLAVQVLLMNWLLDLLVLVPLMVEEAGGSGTALSVESYVATVPYWFRRVGGGYVAFVAMCVVAGDSSERRAVAVAEAEARAEAGQRKAV